MSPPGTGRASRAAPRVLLQSRLSSLPRLLFISADAEQHPRRAASAVIRPELLISRAGAVGIKRGEAEEVVSADGCSCRCLALLRDVRSPPVISSLQTPEGISLPLCFDETSVTALPLPLGGKKGEQRLPAPPGLLGLIPRQPGEKRSKVGACGWARGRVRDLGCAPAGLLQGLWSALEPSLDLSEGLLPFFQVENQSAEGKSDFCSSCGEQS